MDRTLSEATTLGQSGPGSNDNEGVLHIPQSSSNTGTSPSNCSVSYPGHLRGSYHSAKVHQYILQPQPTGQLYEKEKERERDERKSGRREGG